MSTFLLCLDSVREWDETGRRIRHVGGPQPPTEREGAGWRRYASISEPTSGSGTQIVWEYSIDPASGQTIARSTLTSAFIAAFPVNPAVGPWRRVEGGGGEAEKLTDDAGRWAFALSAEGAWVLGCLLNVAPRLGGEPSPTALFSGAEAEGFGAILAAGEPVAFTPVDDLDFVLGRLALLPRNPAFPVALRAAAHGKGGWSPPEPVWKLGADIMLRALVAAGLTDAELETLVRLGEAHVQGVAKRATELEDAGHGWHEVGLLLRRRGLLRLP